MRDVEPRIDRPHILNPDWYRIGTGVQNKVCEARNYRAFLSG